MTSDDDEDLRRSPHHNASAAIWVYSDLTPSGDYALAIQYSEDGMFYPKGPAAYARQVIAVAVRAAHDAAIMGQTRYIGDGDISDTEIYHSTIGPLREDRPPLNDAATHPLVFTGIMAARNGQPYIHVHTAGGEPIAQWTFAKAMSHAAHVLAVIPAVDLDNAYRRHLTGTLGIEPGRAQAVIADLARFMADFEVGGTQDEDDFKITGREISHAQAEAAVMAQAAAAKTIADLKPPETGPEPTMLRLARALRDGGAPDAMVLKAAGGYYDEFKGPLATPMLVLHADLLAAARADVDAATALTALAGQVRDGDFDATPAESAAWAASAEGQATFGELLGHKPPPGEPKDEP